MEERCILGQFMYEDSYCADNYHLHQKKEGHSGVVNSNKEGTVLLSEFEQLLKHVVSK